MITTAKWKLDEYHRMVEAGILRKRRVELLKGEIVEMAPEGKPHAYFSDEAGEYLVRLLGDRARVCQAKPITLPNNSEPEPDLAIIERLGQAYQEHHPYAENTLQKLPSPKAQFSQSPFLISRLRLIASSVHKPKRISL